MTLLTLVLRIRQMKDIILEIKQDEAETKKVLLTPRAIAVTAMAINNFRKTEQYKSLSDSDKMDLQKLVKALHESWFEAGLL